MKEEKSLRSFQASEKSMVYFDGACPVCSREINTMKSSGSDSLGFVDIHTLENFEEKDRDTLLKDLHIKTREGTWLVGLDANIYMWEQRSNLSKGSTFLFYIFAKFLKLPLLNSIAQRGYGYWARRRYSKLYK